MRSLKAKPVRRCGRPRYPTRRDVERQPALLREHVPPEWLGRREAAGILALALAVTSEGCSDKNNSTTKAPDEKPIAAMVAPVFEHGEGRGSTGCIVVTPPAFLSEDEALQLIREELAQAGLQATEQDVPVEGVKIPARIELTVKEWVTGQSSLQITEVPGQAQPLTADLKDPRCAVGITFISANRCGRFEPTPAYISTVRSFDCLEVAHYVSKKARESGRGLYFGVLYDPVARPSATSTSPATGMERLRRRQHDREEAKAESQRLLRLQVKDFIDWLKAQGAI